MKKVIVLAVGGGIAAYKTATVCSRLSQAGHEVRVAMTHGRDPVRRHRDVCRVVGTAGGHGQF